MTAGPIERNSNPFSRGSVAALGGGGGGGGVAVCVCAQTRPAMARHDTAIVTVNGQRKRIGARIFSPVPDNGVAIIVNVTRVGRAPALRQTQVRSGLCYTPA